MGKSGRKQAEAEFLKITLLSKSNEPIFFYSDLPISDAGQDENFRKKWVKAMTMLLKKGLHLNMVHNIDRPINEMLLGLESWIPIYMTGSITPYYYKNPPSNFFNSSFCSSGVAALCSECIKNDEEKSRFYLTTKKDELSFYKEKTKHMLSKAKPLMEIFKDADKEKFKEFMEKQNKNDISKIKNNTFKNIDFEICKDKWIMINKKTAPKMHFIIYNVKLRSALKMFLTN